MSLTHSPATSKSRSKKRAVNSRLIYSARCGVCKDATLTAYAPETLHALAALAGWSWINDCPVCLRCLNSDDPSTRRTLRHVQGVYIEEKRH